MSLNPGAVGKIYDGAPVEIHRGAAMFFALSVGDTHPAYYDGRRPGGVIAPPMYAAVYGRDPIRLALKDKTVGIQYDQLFHYAQTFYWRKAVRPGDVISSRAVITEVLFFENGGTLKLETVSVNQRGETVVQGDWTYFDRSAGKPGAKKTSLPPAKFGAAAFDTRIDIPTGQTFMYAEASGDENPLHTDDAYAQSRGLSGVIVHGFCTMSLVHRAAARALCDEEPMGISTLSVRFARPVFPGSSFRLKGFKTADKPTGTAFGLIAEDPNGKAVLKDAYCITVKAEQKKRDN